MVHFLNQFSLIEAQIIGGSIGLFFGLIINIVVFYYFGFRRK